MPTTPAQTAGLVQLLDTAFSEYNQLQPGFDITFVVRPSGVVQLFGSEFCEFTNLPSYFMGCVTPTGVVHDYVHNPIEC